MNSVQHSYDSVKRALDASEWQPGERLPSLAQLAVWCGVSRTTMWSALQLLKKDSLVHANRGGSIFAGPIENGAPPLRATASGGRIWERLKDRIGRDILAGVFARSELPRVGKLALQYHTSALTLRKALSCLEANGLLVSHGHCYSIAGPQIRRRLSRVVLISLGGTDNNIEITEADIRTRAVVDTVERDCLTYGFECSPLGFNDRHANGLLTIKSAVDAIPGIAGFVVNIWVPWEEAYRNRWFDLFKVLASRRAPVVIIDQTGNMNLPAFLSNLRNIRVLRTAGAKAGATIGDLVLRRGHRDVAFVSSSFMHDWAKVRYAGLRRHFEQFGGPNARLKLFARNEVMDAFELVLELLDLDANEVRSLFGVRFAPEGIAVMLKTLERIKRQPLLISIPHDSRLAMIRSDAHHLAAIASRPYDPETMVRLYDAFYGRASSHAFEIYLRPFLENVAANASATAWVCSDDKTAQNALFLLLEKKTKIPEELAVVGFDNWHSSFACGLSSYDFNMVGIVQQALLLIAHERSFKAALPVSEVEGYVVERRTTRR